jgi:NitT/TauT family transport system substrate-binding protein
MNTRYRWQAALLVLVTLLAAGVGPFAPMASAQTPAPVTPAPTAILTAAMTTIKVGHLPSLSFAPLFVALGKGYFAEQGLTLELQEFRGAATLIPFLSTGQLDVAGAGVGTALFNAIGQNMDVKMVASLFAEPPGYGAIPLLVRRDLFESGQVTKPADLKGKKIALNETRGAVEYVLSEALARGGLTVDDVEPVILSLPDMPAALANKAVDAAMPGPPYALTAVENGSATILLKGDEIVDSPQFGVLYFGRRMLDPVNREAGIRFLTAFLKGARDIHGDGWRKPENIAILNKYTKFEPQLIEKTDHYYCDPNGQINKASLEKIQAYYLRRGYTELSAPLDLARVIDETFLPEALARAGRFGQ